jgi:UDP-glucose 4-epimerase
MKVLITGGAGFIGSTVASACLDQGITPVIVDNLSTGRAEFVANRIFYRGDIGDGSLIDRVFADHPDIDATIHCAALIVVPESVAQPLRYYRENVAKTVDLVDHLLRHGCERFVFSSSAAIYRAGADFTVTETSTLAPASPYGRTKAMVEQVLADCAAAYPLRIISLRYFNPIGADPRMRTGLQLPRPSHVLGKMIEAVAQGTEFPITGADWPTRDGTGIRDYVHVWDLARAHVLALTQFDKVLPIDGPAHYEVINLGTGEGTTVRELLVAFERVIGRPLPVVVSGSRAGDNAGSYTRSDRAHTLLAWQAELSIEDGIRHSLEWSAIRPQRLTGPVNE